MRAAWRVGAVVVAALLVLTLLDRFVLVELFVRRAGAAAALALVEAVAVIGAGWLARRKGGGLAASFVIGYPIFGTACFLVALLKVNTLTMWLVLLAFAIAGAFAIRNSKSEIRNSKFNERGPATARDASSFAIRHSPFAIESPAANSHDTLGTTAAVLAITLVLSLAFIAAQAPPSSLDELAYHLAIPHTWALEGRAVALPLISHSYFPLGIESADLPPLTILGSIGGGIASHFLHWIAAIATTLLIHRRTRDALLTAAIVTTPALALTAGWSLVDWPLLGICVAMLDADEWDAALPAGLLTKYTFLPIALACVATRMRTARDRVWRFSFLFGCVFFLRNLILTGNPLAPFFGTLAPHVADYRELTLGSYIFDGIFIDESLGASLLAALTAIAGPAAIALLLAGILLWISAPSARLLVPFFGTAAAEAKLTSRVVRVIIAIAIAAQVFLVAYYVDRTNVFSPLAAKQTDEQFLTTARASYPSIAWVNASLPVSSRTLVIGLNETYWFEHPVRGGGNFDGPRVNEYLDLPTPEALRARLAADHITHVAVFNEPPSTTVAKKAEERQTTLSPTAQRTVAQMLDRYTASVTAHGEVTVFRLK
jgi:hypothetical protein